MKKLVFLTLLFCQGCMLRMGLDRTARVNEGPYPPVQGTVKLVCLPCLDFGLGWGIGLMFVDGWPVLFYRE